MKKIKTAILGATGTVGQRMIQMLERPLLDPAVCFEGRVKRPPGRGVEPSGGRAREHECYDRKRCDHEEVTADA